MIQNKTVNRNHVLRNYKREIDAQRKANVNVQTNPPEKQVENVVAVKITTDRNQPGTSKSKKPRKKSVKKAVLKNG